ncbi:p-type atpase (p-atpase) superfamily [Plasmopara halstedii]|uniref:P-type atpase (P-atpase) superfamily n=1 Tax=Plasmopara halstedii TaxID=4781 RepID=A0A0P1B378_PLAHL|nr:p-type atpase (p-atpase) superfamily [Plasmopara halstedii]CEG48542.1 p-type atpase (p-atpase) superfamily [Plasmopara halstedii]|eukprot:XP_024584911.1 p-type atpase (p-atpase) superfamily [Plasmopara halstedii]
MLTWPFLLTVTISILLWFAVGTFISRSSTGFPQATGEMEFLQDLPTFWLVCLLVLSSSLLRDSVWKLVRRFSLPSMYHILQERDLLGLPNSPRRIQREHRHFISNTAWSDGLDTVIDYAKLCKNRSRMESPEEMLMRASPLGERLIVSCSSNTSTDAEIEPQRVIGFQGSEKKRNIRIRGSFQSIGTPDSPPTGMMASFQEPSGSGVVTGFADAPVNSRSYPYVGPAGTYHGYAFSEDENVDSDVETVSARNCRVEKDRAKAAFGAHVSIKKVYKSVRGRKNA